MRDIESTFKEKLYECNKHKEKILDAKDFLKDYIPFSVESYMNIGKVESSFIDQLIYRFSKLQDTLGEKIFRGILILSKENVKKMTFLDILNRLEELEVINRDEWIALREIRNEATHEYSFNQAEVVDSINLIYQKSQDLIDIYDRVVKFVNSKFNIGV